MPNKRTVAQELSKAKKKQKRESLLDNLRTGMSIKAACAVSGISKQTYYNWLEESGVDGKWAEEVEAAIRFSEAVQLQRLKDNVEAKQDWRGNAWLLERRFPEEYGAKREVELNVNESSNKGDEMVMEMIRQISKPYEESTDEEG
jgi:transposase